MRPIWTGAIGFGLVNIPVRLYSATQSSTLDLDMLDKKDLSNIAFKRVNVNTGREVAWDNIVKGYKLPNEQYVVLTTDDFNKAMPEKTKTISIQQFIDASEIDNIYYETPYYLEPDKSGERPYALLREVLSKTGKVGIATFVLRNKESIAVLSAHGKVIVLNRMRFGEEIRSTEELSLPGKSEVKPAELKMAIMLVNQLTDKFDISGYHDSYTKALLKFIHAKAKGIKVKEPKLKVVHRPAKDIMDQLKASLSPPKRKRAS